MPDLPFTSFAFPAKNPASGALGNTNRTMPDRLSDVQNVRDWGATGAPGTDQTAPIQAAIDYCINNTGGGYVFFPPGTYPVTGLKVGTNNSALRNNGVRLEGSGWGATSIAAATGAGQWTVSKGTYSYGCMEAIQNLAIQGSGIGAIQVDETNIPNVWISSVRFSGNIGIDCTNAVGASIFNSSADVPAPNQANGGLGYGSFQPQGSIGIALGGGGITSACDAPRYDISIAISGSGVTVLDNRGDTSNIGMRIGWGVVSNAGAEIPATGCLIASAQVEQSNIGMELYNCSGCIVLASLGGGHAGLPNEMSCSGTWASGIVTITTGTNHNIPVGTHVFLQIESPSNTAYIPNYASNANGILAATVTTANQFTYALAANPGGALTSGMYTYPLCFNFRFRKVSQCFIMTANSVSNVAIADYDMDYGGDVNAIQNNNVMTGINAAKGFILPRAANKASWKYINCVGGTNYLSADVTSTWQPANVPASAARVGFPDATMRFADLPGQTGVNQSGPFDGQEYIIIDSTVAATGNWNATVSAGGGSNRVKVRYDSSGTPGWRISG